ncbi:MAG: LPS export ABC transporter periplasmic protein LptC [Hyphomonadaceae bacterium]|jgi:lipopolysaccharide transport protein LptA|nr:LPS export ABC transporter periplasmic protein LptC [Hyphomonadaceae bacterium]
MAITFDTRDARDAGHTGVRASARVADRARAFAIARRHSRLVRLLRVALPLAAGGILAAYALLLTVSWHQGKGRIQVSGIQVTADDLTMKDPTYFGVNKDGGRYRVQAKRAVVGLNQSAPIKLIDIGGELMQTGNAVTTLKAKHGLFDNAKGELELFDGIEIDGANGLTARLSRAMVYSKESRVVSKHPVVANTPTGSVQASSMIMNTKTKAVAFRGAVAVRLLPGAQGPVALGRDPRQPVDIYAEELDIDDAQKTAHFRDRVAATQGDTTLKTPYLFVKYEGKAAAGLPSAVRQPGEGEQGGTRVTFLWARNGVDVTAGSDRRITSDLADFDATAETALFVGNVHITQDRNRLDGGRLFVDRKTGKSRLESPAEGGQAAGRIAASFHQGESKVAQPKAKTATETASAAMFGSFKSDPNAPMEIEADTLDVNDASKRAIFNGDVWARQGGMVIRAEELTAVYTGQSGLSLTGSGDERGPKAGSAQIVRVEAKRKVLITSKDGESASADWANFDVKANTALLGGSVVVMRGKDMAEGPRLKIDLTTGMYRFELEGDAAAAPGRQPGVAPSAPATSSSLPEAPDARTCPPGKQCMLFYPKEVKDKAKDLLQKGPLPDAR